MTTCPHCHQEIITPEATRVSISGMFDRHLFCKLKGSTVDDIIKAWREQNSKPYPAIVGGDKVDDLGPITLCPAIVLSGDSEIRRVGPMVFPASSYSTLDETKVAAYRDALLADPDIPRLLSEQWVNYENVGSSKSI